MSVTIHPIDAGDEAAFLDAVQRSRALLDGWVHPPSDATAFAAHLAKYASDRCYSYLAKTTGDELIGCININDIVRGAFQSAYLGYYTFLPHNGRGRMKQAMRQVIALAFSDLGLHRLEANIQPNNLPSIGLVQSLGFRLEGFSPRYLRIGGTWRDHQRYAITVEEWPPST